MIFPACRLPVGRQGRQVSPILGDFRSPSRFDPAKAGSGGGLGKILYTFLCYEKMAGKLEIPLFVCYTYFRSCIGVKIGG
ncbi:MAG: hypothetical protein V2A64_05490 [Candidatus Omnitrophota bacterium]